MVDYSTARDGLHEHLLCYCDHDIKIANCRLLTNKYLMAVACALLSIFWVTSPLDVLQSNNAGEFINSACSSKTAYFTLEEMQIIIIQCCQIWLDIK